MDSDTLVEKSIDEVRKLVEELPRHGFPVVAALWLKANVNEKWYFYIVSPVVDEAGITGGSRRLQPVVREMPLCWIEPLKIRLAGTSTQLGRDVLAILQQYPGPRVSPIRWPGIWLGNMSIEAAYLFPAAGTHALTKEGS
jgi:hypothetical protein